MSENEVTHMLHYLMRNITLKKTEISVWQITPNGEKAQMIF